VDVLAGKSTFATLATSAYINVDEAQVARVHAAALRVFEAALAAESGLELPTPPRLRLESDPRRYGSRIVPEQSALQAAMAVLDARRRACRLEGSLSELARAWNLIVVTAWLRFTWATAVRPSRDPILTRDGFDAELDWVVIGDKDSPLSREIRLVPLPRGEGRRLAQLQACGDRARFRLRVSGRIRFGQEVERALFFLVAGSRAM